MPSAPDYYHVLGVAPSATATEIKSAYYAGAKRTHPDAGGSAEAMKQLNEAYATLSNPLLRADYDRTRLAAAGPQPPASRSGSSPAAQSSAPGGAGQTAQEAAYAVAQQEYEHEYRHALKWARRSALKLFRDSLIAALILLPITPFLAAHVAGRTSKIGLALLAFAPVYTLAMAAIFIIQPRLRLELSLIWHRGYRLNKHDRRTFLILFGAAIPLAAIWVILFFASLIP